MKDKDFWEWCGFEIYSSVPMPEPGADGVRENELPPTDLNNLFKYAVPKLIGDYKYTLNISSDVDFETRENLYTVDFSSDPLVIDAEATDKDPALALRKAIEELIESGG